MRETYSANKKTIRIKKSSSSKSKQVPLYFKTPKIESKDSPTKYTMETPIEEIRSVFIEDGIKKQNGNEVSKYEK